MTTNNAINLKDAGLASYDGNGTFAGRSIAAGSSKLSTSNANGVSGDPTVNAVEANFTLDNIGGTLGIAKGGTGQTTATAAFDALAPTTTKGDIIVNNELKILAITEDRIAEYILAMMNIGKPYKEIYFGFDPIADNAKLVLDFKFQDQILITEQ